MTDRTLHADATDRDWWLLFAAWSIVTLSTAGSLFFSYVMEFAPCVLCWYQRICLFPLVVILARGLFPFDRGIWCADGHPQRREPRPDHPL